MGGDVDSYLQSNIQNKNDGVHATSAYVATADDGTDSDNFVAFGIANSNANDEYWEMLKAHIAYLFSQADDLWIGTNKAKIIKFFTNGFSSDKLRMSIDDSGINMASNMKVRENNFNLTDLIMEVNSATAETAAFAYGAKMVIRTDLI
jgi:hypothetical protein